MRSYKPADLLDVRRDQIKGAHGWDGVSDSPVGAEPMGKSHAHARTRMTLTSTARRMSRSEINLTRGVNRLSQSPIYHQRNLSSNAPIQTNI